MDGFTPTRRGDKSPEPINIVNHLNMMNIETFTELFNPTNTDQLFTQPSYSSHSNFEAQTTDVAEGMNKVSDNMDGVHPSLGGKSPTQKIVLQSQVILDPLHKNIGKNASSGSFAPSPCEVSSYDSNKGIPRPTTFATLSEKLLMALSLFKESTGGGILAQVWMPFKRGDEFVLSTSEQPYLLDQVLAGYREVSRVFTFSARKAPGSVLGLPGRVFISGTPEWTSNIIYYSRLEYLRVDHAIKYEVRGSLALPIFDANNHSCCAVLELVTTKEKPDFGTEADSVCNALQAVNLKSIKPHVAPQVLSLQVSQRSAFTEIQNVLRVVCHAHMLPLALTWIPFNCYEQSAVENMKSSNIELISSTSKREIILHIQESACYVNDQHMLGFLHVCSEKYLQKGHGIVGQAIQSNRPSFSSDIKTFDVHEYPLAHHARKFGLQAAVAIRLRSTYTGNDDYILEFFLPVSCKGSVEQQLLLNNLSITLQRICGSLRTVSYAKVGDLDALKVSTDRSGVDFSLLDFSEKHGHSGLGEQTPNKSHSCFQTMEPHNQIEAAHLSQINLDSPKHQKKSRSSTVEKDISVSVLQRYYSGTLKDAAKSIGVCPTTLKRICRQNGISRWPSRKIKKVNHSVEKIQSIIDSVPGVMGMLKYNPTTGSLVSEISSSDKEVNLPESLSPDALSTHSTKGIGNTQILGTSEADNHLIGAGRQMEGSGRLLLGGPDKAQISPLEDCNEHSFTSVGGMSNLMKDICHQNAFIKGDVHSNSLKCRIVSRNSSSKLAMEEMQKEIGTCDHIMKDNPMSERRYPSCSNRTDSSSGSASSDQTTKRNVETGVLPVETSKLPVNSGTAISVKATYKEDMVRFKFYPSMGCSQLLEEIGKRFNLPIGTFQLKYKDEEEEWVMLVNDADLQECMEMLESFESQCLRLLVRDVTTAFGSSSSSNSLFLKP